MKINGKKKQHITAFYMEMLVLIAVFVMVILILTRVFALARQQSARAEILTNSVCLAENTAEIVAASENQESFLVLMRQQGDVELLENGESQIYRTRYDNDRNPAIQGNYIVDVEWKSEEGTGGNFVKSVITVYWSGEEAPVYTLETGLLLH